MTNNAENIHSDTSETPWSPPPADRIREALVYERTQRLPTVTRTIILKLHKPSRRKERALLWAQIHVTNMTAHILETLREDPEQFREDGAFACVVEMLSRKAQGEKGDRTQVLADILSECFLQGAKHRPKRPKLHWKQRRAQVMAIFQRHSASYRPKKPPKIVKRRPAIVPKLTEADFPLTGVLRSGVFRQDAGSILNWYLRIIGEDPEGEVIESSSEVDSKTSAIKNLMPIEVPDMATIHASWAAQRRVYETAAQTIVPFGRHRGKTLEIVGKREVRWIRERLVSQQVIESILKHITVLLHPEWASATELRASKQARHPWRRRTNLQRATRAGRLIQRTFDTLQPLIRLDTLNTDELQILQSELEEMRQFGIEFDKIRNAVEIFLQPAPPRYPTVQSIVAGAQRQAVTAAYHKALSTLQTDVLDVEREATVVTELLQAESALDTIDLQPLNFKRTMRPPKPNLSFALLYSVSKPSKELLQHKYRRMSSVKREARIAEVLDEGEIYTYVLAVVVHSEAAFRGEDAVEQFVSEVKPGLFYVNFPETPFISSEDMKLLLFPLECGKEYHEEQFLRSIIDRQRKQQQMMYVQEQEKRVQNPVTLDVEPSLPSSKKRKKRPLIQSPADCLPESAIGSARLVSQRTFAGHYEFYVHLPIENQTVYREHLPETVIGIHEHRRGYSYAVLDLAGNFLTTNDVFIPSHVQFKEGDVSYSDNYVFEVVKQMISLATCEDRPDAVIGLEGTMWKKQNVHLSHEQNREQFSRPSKKVATTLKYKASVAGLIRPFLGINVSLQRCSHCGIKREQGTKNIYPKTEVCPSCGSLELQQTSLDASSLHCAKCKSVSQAHEPWFVCDSCGHRQLARFNTAVVIAQYTLSKIISRYETRGKQKYRKRRTVSKK